MIQALIVAHFNPRSPHGERHVFIGSCPLYKPFQPTLPARGATKFNLHPIGNILYFNPRSPHGERPIIHCCNPHVTNFNPRSPHGERQNKVLKKSQKNAFQPTLPARGATSTVFSPENLQALFQPTLPARGATFAVPKNVRRSKFQPTLPARGATPAPYDHMALGKISTHAPRTGSDRVGVHSGLYCPDFNPRSPHGERLSSAI